MLIGHFGSKPSNPNLVELGLANDLDELAAPGDPEPAVQKAPIASQGEPTSETIDLFAMPMNPAGGQPTAKIDSDIKPTSYLDTAGVIELDNPAHQWMPFCHEAESGPIGSLAQDHESTPDRMPRCEGTLSSRLLESPKRPR